MIDSQWLPIETAPKTRQPWTMFVVIAFNIKPQHCSSLYATDPYCVWREIDGSFARWPHSFEPTHWCPLPDHNPKSQPMNTPLSTAATAVLEAYMNNCGWLDGPLEKDYRCAAAVLRAVAGQVIEEVSPVESILSIAIELDSQS